MDGSANERGAQMSTGLQVKVVLAGVAAHALSRLQSWTRGRIGGFDLYHRLWQVYTLDCRVSRSGYVMRDLCPIGLRAAVRELVGTLADVLQCGDLRGHLAPDVRCSILQLCAKHSPDEFQVAIVDTKLDFAGAFDRLPNLFAPIAHTVEDGARLVEAVEQERRRRQAVMAVGGVADWRALAEPFSLLLLIVDEAADFARDPAMDTLVEVARKGRAFGVSIALGTRLPSARVINPQVRATLPLCGATTGTKSLTWRAIVPAWGLSADRLREEA